VNVRLERAGRDDGPQLATHVWLFYASERQAAAGWVDDITPGEIFFWRYGSTAYTKQLKVGDTVVVMVGSSDEESQSAGARIIATGLLAADDSINIEDTEQNARSWPVLCIDAFQDRSIDRRDVEASTGVSIRQQGAVHPITLETLHGINEHLSRSGLRQPLPVSIADAVRAFDDGEALATALAHHPRIKLADGASQLAWPPQVPPRDSDLATQIDSGVDLDAYVPFRNDAPSESEDALDRGPLALFLARRLHLIWCEMNGCAPSPRSSPEDQVQKAAAGRTQRPSSVSAETDTFIVHIDSPWGGGKTTFANFVARVLDPRRERLSERHFLRSVARPFATSDELAETTLQQIFFLDPNADEKERERWPEPARQHWIIARYNAWRDHYVQPPWWHVFLTVEDALCQALRSKTGRGTSRLFTRNWWKQTFVDRRAWNCRRRLVRIRLDRLGYLIFNTKIRNQLSLLALAGLVGLVIWQTELVTRVLDLSGHSTPAAKSWIDFLVAALGVAGVSVTALFSTISQSLAPELEFTAEHKQIGVRDPIGRFRESFGRIMRHADRPVLLIVDDIDRCEPKVVVELLRGFQTILRSPRLFVLVLGDRSWIEKSHEIHHRDLAGITVGTESKLGARFVEKVFQLSFTLPAMKPEVRRRFTRAVIEGATDTKPLLKEGMTDPPSADQPLPLDGTQHPVNDQQSMNGQSARNRQAPAFAPTRDVLRELEQKLDMFTLLSGPVGRREQLASAAKQVALRYGASEEEIDALTAIRLVVASGADASYHDEVYNALSRLAGCLPNNPRQIKRIVNAFAIYEAVGRLYFNYRLTSDNTESGRLRARRWRQLAIWVTLATEWPDTWRALAREPMLLEAAYAEDLADHEKIRQLLLDRQSDEEAKKTVAATLHRLVHDRSLLRLLGSDSDARARLAAGRTTDEADTFAATRVEAAAVYEFNRIMWAPGFPTTPPP
jgi:KAP family P-loop domain